MQVAKFPRAIQGTRQAGFTLIEGIITIVILGIAMVTLTSFLFPQLERSAVPHYQARSAAIGNAVLNETLSRKFDEHSDPNNDSRLRCGEEGAQVCTQPNKTNKSWPEDKPQEYITVIDPIDDSRVKRLDVAVANDVDDFHGCWGERKLCRERYGSTDYPWRGLIENLIEPDSEQTDKYFNMTVRVDVAYGSPDGELVSRNLHKRIETLVNADRYGEYKFVAYRSNY